MSVSMVVVAVQEFEGLHLCEGCRDVLVLTRMCKECEQIDMDLESRLRAYESTRNAAELAANGPMPVGSFDLRDQAVGAAHLERLHAWPLSMSNGELLWVLLVGVGMMCVLAGALLHVLVALGLWLSR